MTTLDILKAARAKIAQGWCRKWFSQDENGNATEANSDQACKWCALGAIYAIIPANVSALDAAMVLRSCLPNGEQSISIFNDAQGSAYPILELYDLAIAKEKARMTESVNVAVANEPI